MAHDRCESHGQQQSHHPSHKAEQRALGHELGKDTAPCGPKELAGSHLAGTTSGDGNGEVDVVGHGKEQDEERGYHQDVNERGIATTRDIVVSV